MGTMKIRFLLQMYCYGSVCTSARSQLSVHRSEYVQHLSTCLLLVRLGVELESACLRRIIASQHGVNN